MPANDDRDEPAGPHEDGHRIWATSEVDEAGVYHLNIEFGPDEVVSLSDDEAHAWAAHVVQATAAAMHDASVLRLCIQKDMSREASAMLIADARAHRAEAPEPPKVMGMSVTAGVSVFTGEPFLRVMRHGRSMGQWSVADAEQHALNILLAQATLDLDRALRTALIEEAQLPPEMASRMVHVLGGFRVESEPGEYS